MWSTNITVVNRTRSRVDRNAPWRCPPGPKLLLAKYMSAAMPAHWNESVSVTRTTAAAAWWTKVIGQMRGVKQKCRLDAPLKRAHASCDCGVSSNLAIDHRRVVSDRQRSG